MQTIKGQLPFDLDIYLVVGPRLYSAACAGPAELIFFFRCQGKTYSIVEIASLLFSSRS